MAPTNKAKASGVSASSFLDLKAELAKQESEFSKKKKAGQSYVVGGIQRPDKAPTVWERRNKGVAARNARDIRQEALDKVTAESARAALERKAKIYDKLKKGKTAGLTDAQFDALLVDFDSKGPDEYFSSDSEDVDESLTVPKPTDDENDPIVEYEDEFGRIRTSRRSEIPRDLLPPEEVSKPVDDDPFVIRNPVNYFPVYQPSEERVAAIKEAASEEANPLASHYDAAKEVRAKGAAFYSFSKDEEARTREMEELKKAREETERVRHETGAMDVRPGEIEGMSDLGGNSEVGPSSLPTKNRALEKRKREIEERRKLLEAKRRKMKGVGDDEVTKSQSELGVKLDEASSTGLAGHATSTDRTEHKKADKSKRREKVVSATKVVPEHVNSADDFLARLEQDLLSKR